MPPVPSPGASPDCERDRHGRRAVWITLGITLTIAAIVYSGKAREDRSAIIRWLYQVRELQRGVNIWEHYIFPNPPIFPLTLYPLTLLPETGAAMAWYALKVGLTIASVLMCFRLAMGKDDKRPIPAWVQGSILLLSFRPILSDLHHANNNLLILFLVVSALYAWRRGYDVLAGLALALAITYKVTPALFVPYFLYKRSWRTVGATFMGLGLFFVIVPSAILGPEFNGRCLYYWWYRMIFPYVGGDIIGDAEINQSMAGVLMRLLTFQPPNDGRYHPESGLHLMALDPGLMVATIKGMSVAIVALLAYFCRTSTDKRTDPRLLGEFSLVVLTMLIVSERSWKHHYVTLLLPYTYLVMRVWTYGLSRRARRVIVAGLAASAFLMLSTSSEVGGLFAGGNGDKYALYYGMFFWAGIVLYVATAWRVVAERRVEPILDEGERPFALVAPSIPSPHLKRAEAPTRPLNDD